MAKQKQKTDVELAAALLAAVEAGGSAAEFRGAVRAALAENDGGNEEQRCWFVCEAWESWASKQAKVHIDMELTAAVVPECPYVTISADGDLGMKVMVALSHWAAGAHDVDADTRKHFRARVREFELWREAQK